jgi:EAL domain-containing protein (putative c-di-GMP-specific phosphodiesterase class I)
MHFGRRLWHGLVDLDYLKRIPATEIKIDQTFVGAITRSHSDRLMVRSTIQLVHSLGHVVVAEGVEDQATIDALLAMGCDYAQGFFIGRPIPAEDILRSLGTKQISRAQRA